MPTTRTGLRQLPNTLARPLLGVRDPLTVPRLGQDCPRRQQDEMSLSGYTRLVPSGEIHAVGRLSSKESVRFLRVRQPSIELEPFACSLS